MKKQYYVLWSGGLDSTYLIQTLLDSNPKAVVTAGYVEIQNNEDKTKMELAAINKMGSILYSKYQNRFSYSGVVYRCDVRQMSEFVSLKQVPIWLSAIMSTTPRDTTEICVGYVMNDCAISYLKEFQKVVSSFRGIFPEFPKVSFPLSKIPKDEIVRCLDPQLRIHTVWCEMPHPVLDGFESCGRCNSCLLSLESESPFGFSQGDE